MLSLLASLSGSSLHSSATFSLGTSSHGIVPGSFHFASAGGCVSPAAPAAAIPPALPEAPTAAVVPALPPEPALPVPACGFVPAAPLCPEIGPEPAEPMAAVPAFGDVP